MATYNESTLGGILNGGLSDYGRVSTLDGSGTPVATLPNQIWDNPTPDETEAYKDFVAAYFADETSGTDHTGQLETLAYGADCTDAHDNAVAMCIEDDLVGLWEFNDSTNWKKNVVGDLELDATGTITRNTTSPFLGDADSSFGTGAFLRGDSSTDIDNFMRSFFDLYQKSWKAHEPHSAFLADMATTMFERGWFRPATLLHNKVPVASGYYLVHNGYTYCMKNAYNKDYSHYGVGVIWMAELHKHLIDEDKVTAFDFMRGNEAYKRNWAECRRERKGLMIFNRTPKGIYLSQMLRKILPFIRRSRYLTLLKNRMLYGNHFPE